jgi:hypothetical protein
VADRAADDGGAHDSSESAPEEWSKSAGQAARRGGCCFDLKTSSGEAIEDAAFEAGTGRGRTDVAQSGVNAGFG